MKILIAHNYYQVPGGEDMVMENETRLLSENKFSIVVYQKKNKPLSQLGPSQRMLIPLSFIFSISTFLEVRRLIINEKVDLVHVHNTLYMISPSIYFAALITNTPIVQTVHNFRLLCPSATFYRDGRICEECTVFGLKRAVKYSCYRENKIQTLAIVISLKLYRSIRVYSKIFFICLTDFNKSKLIGLKQINPGNAYVKPNLMDFNSEVKSSQIDKNQFVFVGRLDIQKGIRNLFEAWRQIGSAAPKLIICGTGPEFEWCVKFIEVYKLDSIKMLGYVSNEHVRSVISVSKALIMPTQCYEGYPMTIIEAYSLGTPVIASNIGNVSGLVVNNLTGILFDYNSTVKLREAVEIFDSLKTILSAKRIQDFYREKNSSERNLEELKKIYDDIIVRSSEKRDLRREVTK